MVVSIATLALGLWGVLSWTLIPQGFRGEIESVRYQSETGYMLRVLQLADGRSFVVDHSVVDAWGDRRALVGADIKTGSWQASVEVSRRHYPLAMTLNGLKVMGFLAITCTLAFRRQLSMWWRRRRRDRKVRSGAIAAGETSER